MNVTRLTARIIIHVKTMVYLSINLAVCDPAEGAAKPCTCKEGWKGKLCNLASCDNNYDPCNKHGTFSF